MKSIQGMALAGGVLPPLARADQKPEYQRYRAVSWWLEWDELIWPSDELMDKIRRRADRCAANGVNCCLIFGAHFRWDFMPLWGRLHDMLRFIADELHQRQIVLFDHHSSVLVHRTRNREEALNISRRNRHHVPFFPSREAASTWQFNGSRLNDWRMTDLETDEPVYLPAYNAEQFCMNNPAFRASYIQYVKQLLAETGIDGLMSDDGIFYGGWRACGCRHCRERFQKQYGHRSPAVSDASFWGNRRSAAFADFIRMRFETCGDYLVDIQKILPPAFPFFTCCSSSDGYAMPAFGMSYQDFIRACNVVLLEMVGNTPSSAGTWDERIPSQLLHLGIARNHKVNCLGIGYGYFPDTAFFVWALNKFLGSDCWFSSLKGRLNASQQQLDTLADDSELVGEGYRWEKTHPQLFTGEVDADASVLFSRATRDYYGQCPGDYVSDYSASCLELARAGISYDVVTAIPEPGRRRQLILSSAACLSADERGRLDRFMKGGGTVIATGPAGHYDERARPVPRTWLQDFGVTAELVEPQRAGGYPPGANLKPPVAIAQCRVPDALRNKMRDGWLTVPVGQGHLMWRPERITGEGIAPAVVAAMKSSASAAIAIRGIPSTWRVRQYRDGNRWLIHAIPGKVEAVLHATLQNQVSRERVIEKLRFTPLANGLVLEPAAALSRVVLHSPDLPDARSGARGSGKTWTIDPAGVSRYFVLECFA